MKIIKCKNYEEISERAAQIVSAQVILKPNCVLGLATGSSPIGMYQRLADMKLDFSDVTTFNLDEYYPIKQSNDQSYHYFMTKNFYSKVNLKPENIYIPNGETADAQKECEEYEKKIAAHGGIDLQVLGIGRNGHIGFNEPGDILETFTHITELTQNTIEANARFFASAEEVPAKALTMGVGTIMKARKILLIASGKEKAFAIKALSSATIDTHIPATILAAHRDVTVIADAAALGE